MGMGYGFRCKYCGQAFGNRPDQLEEHIAYFCIKAKELPSHEDIKK